MLVCCLVILTIRMLWKNLWRIISSSFSWLFGLLFFVSNFSREIFRKNEIIETNVEKIDYMQNSSIEHMLTRLNELEKKVDETKSAIGMNSEVLFDEIRMLGAIEHITYEEIIKCFNCYHTNSVYIPIDYTALSRSIYKSYWDVKKEKLEEKLKECKEKKIKIETH